MSNIDTAETLLCWFSWLRAHGLHGSSAVWTRAIFRPLHKQAEALRERELRGEDVQAEIAAHRLRAELTNCLIKLIVSSGTTHQPVDVRRLLEEVGGEPQQVIAELV